MHTGMHDNSENRYDTYTYVLTKELCFVLTRIKKKNKRNTKRSTIDMDVATPTITNQDEKRSDFHRFNFTKRVKLRHCVFGTAFIKSLVFIAIKNHYCNIYDKFNYIHQKLLEFYQI